MLQPTHVTVGVVLVNARGQILMQLRDDKPDINDPACWAVPGGGQDPGESLEQTARREFLEETDYQLDELTLLVDRVVDRGKGLIERQAFFLSRYDGIQAVHCHEGQALVFLEPASFSNRLLAPNLEPVIEAAMREFRNGAARTMVV
jgi:8-oxo-dGTP diphosphatase